MKLTILPFFFVLFSSAVAHSKGTIVVYRPHAKLYGIALTPSVYVDGTQVTRICNGCFFSISVAPGKHMITVGRSEVGNYVESKAGDTLYFKVRGKKSAVVTGASPMELDPVEKNVALKEMKKLKEAK
jgi:hypothetical protein